MWIVVRVDVQISSVYWLLELIWIDFVGIFCLLGCVYCLDALFYSGFVGFLCWWFCYLFIYFYFCGFSLLHIWICLMFSLICLGIGFKDLIYFAYALWDWVRLLVQWFAALWCCFMNAFCCFFLLWLLFILICFNFVVCFGLILNSVWVCFWFDFVMLLCGGLINV